MNEQNEDLYFQQLKKEIRLQFFYPFEIQETDNKLITIKTKSYLFYGYEVDAFQSTNHSNYDSEEDQKSFMGLLFFNSGLIYIGEYNQDFKQKGEGLLFFSIGAVLRGTFQKGFINGSSFLTLPNKKYLYMNFIQGDLTSEVLKINPYINDIDKYKFVQGKFYQNNGKEEFNQMYLKKIQDYLPSNFIPDEIKDYGSSCYFGSFLMEDKSIFYGFIKDGKPQGYGLKVYINFLNENDRLFSTNNLSWIFKNFENSEEDKFLLKKTFDNQIIFFYNKLTEFGIYNQIDNRFQIAKNVDDQIQVQNKNFQGIPSLVSNYFQQHFNLDEEDDLKSDRYFSQMIFNIQNCQEILMFYLYGSLKGNVDELYDDNLQIQEQQFYKEDKIENQDENEVSWSLPDIDFSKKQQNQLFSQQTVQYIPQYTKNFNNIKPKMMSEAKRRQSSQSNQIQKLTLNAEKNSFSFNQQKKEKKEQTMRDNFEKIKKQIFQIGTHEDIQIDQFEKINETLREDINTKENSLQQIQEKNYIDIHNINIDLDQEQEKEKLQINIQKKKKKFRKKTQKKKLHQTKKNKNKSKSFQKYPKNKQRVIQKIFTKMNMIHDENDLQNFCSTFKIFNQFFNQQ